MIKEIAKPRLKTPIFIAAWPGMGEVAYRSVLFLKEVLDFKLLAKLEPGEFFKPAAVTVEKGVLDLPSFPAGFFYYLKRKKASDIILFLGEAQPPLEYGEKFATVILDYAFKHKTKFIFTFAAKPEPIDHKVEPLVWMAATDKKTLKDFSKYKLKILEEGQISGLNGILLGVTKRREVSGICLLGEIPFYMVQIESPKAITAILRIVDKYLGLDLNLQPLVKRSKFIEEEIDKLMAYLKGDAPAPSPNAPSPLSEEDIDKIRKDLAAYSKLPQSARDKIEISFRDAVKDITQASKLKEELDKWNVYKDYEDRFLDLFKKTDRHEETH